MYCWISIFERFCALRAKEVNKIKTETIEGFKEIFLIEENPQEESGFSQIPSEKIELDQWKKIFNIVIQTIKERRNKSKKTFKNKLMEELKKVRKNNEIPSNIYNRLLRNALDIMIDINFIKMLKHPSGQIELSDDYK